MHLYSPSLNLRKLHLQACEIRKERTIDSEKLNQKRKKTSFYNVDCCTSTTKCSPYAFTKLYIFFRLMLCVFTRLPNSKRRSAIALQSNCNKRRSGHFFCVGFILLQEEGLSVSDALTCRTGPIPSSLSSSSSLLESMLSKSRSALLSLLFLPLGMPGQQRHRSVSKQF